MTQPEKVKEEPAGEAKKLTLNKETVKDLDPKARGADVKAGEPATFNRTGCDS